LAVSNSAEHLLPDFPGLWCNAKALPVRRSLTIEDLREIAVDSVDFSPAGPFGLPEFREPGRMVSCRRVVLPLPVLLAL
jgi:hypothetical protein